VKLFGKFLLWVLAYALGAALIVFFLARRPAPPTNLPQPEPRAEAPAESSGAEAPSTVDPSPETPTPGESSRTEKSTEESTAPRQEASDPPPPAPEMIPRPSTPPRRVKTLRIPSR